MHAGALAIVLLTPAPFWIPLLFMPAIGASLVYTLRQHGLRSASSAVSEVELLGETLVLHRKRLSPLHCRVVAQFVHPWVVVLRLSPEEGWRRINLVIARDALPAEQFRILRVELNQAHTPA